MGGGHGVDVDTRLGTLTVEPEHLYLFPYGLPGFPEPRRFFLHGDAKAVHWLLSGEGDRLGLPVVDPSLLVEDYASQLPEDIRLHRPLVRTVVVPGTPPSTRLVAPILLDPLRRIGMQVILPRGKSEPRPLVGVR
jgi:flagellar assembly factor FliW